MENTLAALSEQVAPRVAAKKFCPWVSVCISPYNKRLFKTSAVLKGNPVLKRSFIKQRMDVWFERAVRGLRELRIGGMLCFLFHALSFEPLAWWLPYYLGKFAFRQQSQIKRV